MKKASKNTNAKRGASRRTMWIITAVVLIPAAIILWNTTGRPLVTQADMKRYLEDKYKEKFEVERPEYKNGGLGVNGIWMSQAYLASNPNLKFDIDWRRMQVKLRQMQRNQRRMPPVPPGSSLSEKGLVR